MKKIVLLCLTIILISYNYLFGFSAGFMGSGAAKNAGGGAPTCSETPAVSNTSIADYDSMGSTGGEAYRGQSDWVPGSNQTICRVDFYIKGADASTDYAAVVYNLSGTAIGTEVDASDTSGLSADSWVSFTGLSAAVTTGGNYAIILQHYPNQEAYSAGSQMYHSAAGDGGVTGTHSTWWGDDQSEKDVYAGDISIKIYYLE